MLQDYIQAEQTKLFEELGVFFAFSSDQLEEGMAKYGHLKPEGTKWSSVGNGIYMPSVNVDQFVKRHQAIHDAGIKKDLEINGHAKILERELANYEIGYSYEGHYDQNFRDGIHGYGFTEEEIKAAYKKHMTETEY